MDAYGSPDDPGTPVGFFFFGTPVSTDATLVAARPVDTHCSYCAVQCGLTLKVDADGRVLSGVGRRDFEVNAGRICIKGATAHEQVGHAERLVSPLWRGPQGLAAGSWATVLDRSAEQLRRLQAENGRDCVAVFGSGALSNESVYLLGKFARVALGTPYIDYNGRFCMASGAAANRRLFGVDRGMSLPLAEVPEAQCIILAGSNLSETLGPLAWYFQEAVRRGATLITIDPRRSATARLGSLHLAPKPGSDLALALGLMRVLIHEGFVDADFVARRTTGFEAMAASAEAWTPEAVEAETGVPAADLLAAARAYGNAKTGVVLTSRGVEQQVQGSDAAQAYFQLMVATGKVGKRACGGGCLTGQGNGQGGREHGQKADQLPGYRSISDPADRAAVAAHWGVAEAELPGPGVSAVELFDRILAGKIKALLVFGSNPAVSFPDGHRSIAALKKLELLAVADLFMSETARLAHAVLPVAGFAEKAGSMTNLEGRVVLRQKAVDPPGDAKDDDWILCELAARLGQGARFEHKEPADRFDEFAACTAGGKADYSGMSHARLAGQGLFWPCPEAGHPGTPSLFADRFWTEDGKAHFGAFSVGAPAEAVDAEYPLYLTTGRVLAHYLSGSITRRIPKLVKASPACFAELSPLRAEALGLAEGATVRLASRRGALELPLRLNPGLRDDTVFVPFHWGDAQSANLLTLGALDPVSKMPSFKACAVRAERLPQAA
jgi:assimilatory nitrate reductase catalytic subunit